MQTVPLLYFRLASERRFSTVKARISDSMGTRASVWLFGAGFTVCVMIFSSRQIGLSADTDSPGVNPENQPPQSQETNLPALSVSSEVIQQVVQQLRREMELFAKQPAEPESITNSVAAPDRTEALEQRLVLVERMLQAQRQSELETVHSSYRALVIVAGILGGVVLAGILCAVVVLTRAMNRLSELALRLPVSGWAPSQNLPGLAASELLPGTFSQAEQISAKFIGTVERLEKRILEMEQLGGHRLPAELESPVPTHPSSTTGAKPVGEESVPQFSVLIGKGQALLNLGQVEEALHCFDRAITLDPGSADALIKRGMALERLHKMEQALDSYDRAIAADSSMTLAYLHKGAVCNRLQRFQEALACYEKALKTEPVPAAL